MLLIIHRYLIFVEILATLFQDLYFDVEIYKDVDSNALSDALTKAKEIDHSNYDAFVCCILSHGKFGMRILDLEEHFADIQCPNLKRKPKMFFIQSSQPGLMNCIFIRNEKCRFPRFFVFHLSIEN